MSQAVMNPGWQVIKHHKVIRINKLCSFDEDAEEERRRRIPK